MEQLPGCKAPGGRSWAKADSSDREYAATEYLFREALDYCDKSATQRFAKLLGATSTKTTAVPKVTRQKTALKAPNYVQTRLTTLSAQKEMIKQWEQTVAPRRSPRNSPKDKE